MDKMNPIYFAPERKPGGGWVCFKSSPSAPAAPDPAATAAAQTGSNIQTANANAILNRVNQVTPYGNQTYTAGTPNADGTSQWTSTTTLAPAQQALLNSSNQISQSMADLGQNQIGNVSTALAKPLDFSGATPINNAPMTTSVNAGQIQNGVDMSKVPGLIGGDQLQGAMKQAQDAAYAQAQSRLDPQWGQQQHDLQNQLTQQGVMQNSDAWNRAMDDFSRQRNDAYQTAQNNSIQQGNAAEAQLYGQGLSSNQNAYGQALNNGTFANTAQAQGFGQGMQNADLANRAAAQQFSQSLAARQQNINELMTQQQNPLNVLNALRTGAQVSNPSFGTAPQTNVAGTNIAGINQQQYANNMGLYNSQVQANNNVTSGLFGLGAAAVTALSDRRLKRNIRRIGKHRLGIGIYSYDYLWGDHGIGVMADEVETVMPSAVINLANGFKAVDYGRLQ